MEPPNPIWRKIWDSNYWPKISTFLWLLTHHKILTWDNLLKRGFLGLSFCIMCREHSETIDHLLDYYVLADTIWNLVEVKCNKTKRVKSDVINTLQSWGEDPYQCKLLNRLRLLITGFVVWNIWKEINQHIFNGKQHNVMEVWLGIHTNIHETLMIKDW